MSNKDTQLLHPSSLYQTSPLISLTPSLSRLSPALSKAERTAALQAEPRFSVDGVLTVTGQGTIVTGLVNKLELTFHILLVC